LLLRIVVQKSCGMPFSANFMAGFHSSVCERF